MARFTYTVATCFRCLSRTGLCWQHLQVGKICGRHEPSRIQQPPSTNVSPRLLLPRDRLGLHGRQSTHPHGHGVGRIHRPVSVRIRHPHHAVRRSLGTCCAGGGAITTTHIRQVHARACNGEGVRSWDGVPGLLCHRPGVAGATGRWCRATIDGVHPGLGSKPTVQCVCPGHIRVLLEHLLRHAPFRDMLTPTDVANQGQQQQRQKHAKHDDQCSSSLIEKTFATCMDSVLAKYNETAAPSEHAVRVTSSSRPKAHRQTLVPHLVK